MTQEDSPEYIDPRALRTQEALHEAMLQLLQEKNLEQISVREIVAKAGVGYNTFFRHHPSKESLLEAIANQQISALFELSLPVLDAKDIGSASYTLLSYVHDNWAIWKTLLTGGAAGVIREEFLQHAQAIANMRGESHRLMPPDLGTILIVSSVLELLTWWLKQRNPLPIDHIAEIMDCSIVSPIIEAGKRRR